MASRTIPADEMIILLGSLDEAIALIRSVRSDIRLSTKLPEATGHIIAVRSILIRYVVQDVEAEALPQGDKGLMGTV